MKINKNITQIIKSKYALFFIIFLSLFTNNINAQGVDAVFFLDNSSSIDVTEWSNMSISTKALIDEVLECNPHNRVSVTHFAGHFSSPISTTDPRIFIESDFTNNAGTAKGFVRRGGSAAQGGTHTTEMGSNTWLYENTSLLENALGISAASAQIMSAQKKLIRDSKNRLVIFIFTDAPATGNGLIRSSGIGVGSTPFFIYNQVKTTLGATFVVLHAPTGNPDPADTNARAAAAAIASVGGSYNGDVQANAGDPQGSGTKPRKAVMSSTFDISTINIETLAEDICRSCAPTVEINSVTPPTQNVCINSAAQILVSDAIGTGILNYQWYSNTTNSTSGGTAIPGAIYSTYTPSTSTLGTTYYYVVVSDTYCEGQSTSAIVSVSVTSTGCYCYKPAATGGTVLETKHGITALGRAGTDNGNWPMVRKGAWTALESKEKGFVVNRIPTTAALSTITNPIEGMMVYDEEADCLKIYTTTNGTTFSWQCFNTQACPE